MLTIVHPGGLGHEGGIRDQVVHEVSRQRAQIAEVAHLQGRSTQRQYPGPAVLGVASQVHGNVDLQSPGQQRDLLIGLPAHIQEALEGVLHALSHRIARVGAVRERRDLES